MKKLSEKLVAGGFSLALLLLTCVGAAAYLNVQRLIENKHWVEHTRQVLENMDKISEGIKDAQSGRRGYIITGKAIHLETYKAGVQTTERAIKNVRQLTRDNQVQQRRLDELEVLITKRLAKIANSIKLFNQNKNDIVSQTNMTNQGVYMQQKLQEKLAVMEGEEKTLLQRRSAATDANVNNTIRGIVLGYSLSFGLLIGIYFLLKEEISDRIQAEAALQRSQNELKTLLENSPDAIVRVDRQLRHTYVNSALEREAGIPVEAFIGKTFSEVGFSVELADFLQASHQKVFSTGKLNVVEFYYPSPKGLKLIQSLIAPEFTPAGSVESTLSISRDITPLKQAELDLKLAKEELEIRVEERTAELTQIIVELQQAQAALRESERRYAALTEASPVGIFYTDTAGEGLYWNQRCIEMFGMTLEEVGKEGWPNRLHPEDRARVVTEWYRCVEENVPFKLEYRWLRPDGIAIWLLGQALAEKDGEGKVIGYVGTVTDIGDRKQAEAAVYRSDSILNSVLETTPDIIFVKDLQNRYVVANSTAANVIGIRLEEMIGKDDNQLFPPEIAEQMIEVDRAIIRAGKASVYEEAAPKPGRMGTLLTVKCPWRDAEGNIIGVIGISRDISDRKQAEMALQQQAEQLRLVMEIAQRIRQSLNLEEILHTTVEEVRQFIRTDRAIIFRFESDWSGTVVVESVGAEWTPILSTNIYDPCFGENYIAPFEQGLVTAKADIYTAGIGQCHIELLASFQVRANLVVPILNGENLWGLLIAHHCSEPREWQPLEIDLMRQLATQVGIAIQQSTLFEQLQGELIERKRAESALQQAKEELEIRVQERTKELSQSNAALQAEIAERKQAEQKLEQVAVDLKRSNQELEQFAYLASHDLQEPLRAVEGYTKLLVQEYENRLDETAQEYAGYIVDGATRMRQLIQDMLAYSRVGTRGQKFVSTDCNRVLGLALHDLQVAIAENNAIITHDNLPTIKADTNQLVQLFQNLIGNAIKFRRDEPPQVHISAELRNNEILFGVRDNGIGIKPRYRDRIFEIFKRLHTRKEFPGTGIGLAICKKIVERHGGKIWADSQPGVGTTFFFTLPITPSASLPDTTNSDD